MKATYTVKVHVDADGDMVIVHNPTLAPAIEKSDYEPKTPEADASVDADTVNDATAFLETFFKLYPTATEKELAYYVSGNMLEPIGRDYLYSELVNPIFTKDGDAKAIEKILAFYDPYISKCCLRPLYDEYGNVYIAVDMELKGRIREALIKMMLDFDIPLEIEE